MASAQKLPSGSWRCRIHIGEGKYKSFTADTKKEALQRAYKYMEDHPSAAEIREGGATVKRLMQDYIDSKRNIISPTTVISYDKILRLYFLEIQEKRVRDLSHKMIQDAVNDLAATVSPKTVRNAYSLLRASVRRHNPSLFEEITLPKREVSEMRIPTNEEVCRILQYYKDTRYELPLALAAFCGLRREEILALTYSDFDFERHIIHINKALVKTPSGKYAVNRTKTPLSRRDVYCPTWILQIAKKQADGQNTARIAKMNVDALYNALIRAQDNLQIQRFRLHDLRHYACSMMIALGYPYLYIRRAMGHASDNMINQVYGHVMQDKKQELETMLDENVTNIMTRI